MKLREALMTDEVSGFLRGRIRELADGEVERRVRETLRVREASGSAPAAPVIEAGERRLPASGRAVLERYWPEPGAEQPAEVSTGVSEVPARRFDPHSGRVVEAAVANVAPEDRGLREQFAIHKRGLDPVTLDAMFGRGRRAA